MTPALRPALRPALSSLYPYTMASEAKMESTELEESHAKRLEQPAEGGVEYQGL